ncbi:mercury resistance protein [Nannochloropsis oceanica]
MTCLSLQTQLALGLHHHAIHRNKYNQPFHALQTFGRFSDIERVGRQLGSVGALRIGFLRTSGGRSSSSGSSSSSSSSNNSSSSSSSSSNGGSSSSSSMTSNTGTESTLSKLDSPAYHKSKEEEAPVTSTKAAAAPTLPQHHTEADDNGSGGGIEGRNRELLATFTMVASVLCAIDCTVFPVLLTVLPAAEWLGGVDLHALSTNVALYLVLPIGSTTTLANWLMHRNLTLAAMSVGGLSLILMSNYAGLTETLGWMQDSRMYNTVGCGLLLGSSWLAHHHEKDSGHHGGEKGGTGKGKKRCN